MKQLVIGHWGLMIFLLSGFLAKAQQPVELNNTKGIVTTYLLSKIDSSDSKKDKYVAVVTTENRNNYDMFYNVIPGDGIIKVNEDNNKVFFSEVTIDNVKGFLAENKVKLQGQLSRLLTMQGYYLYMIPKQNPIKQSISFSVSKGETPVLSYKIYKRLNKLIDYY